jgi:Holliday junction DNA helicase RuvA
MIGHLRGRLLAVEGTEVLIDVGGVGYEVVVDRQTMAGLGTPGFETALWIRTAVREDAITLYGFATADARLVYDLLTGVSGVGPKLASQILGGMPLEDLVQAVREKDLKRLCQISGVGKKMAERLALELAEKFMALPIVASSTASGLPAGLMADVRSALGNLGFPPRDVEAAIRGLKPGQAKANLEDVVREALAILASR